MTAAYLMLLVDPRPERPAIAGVELYSSEHPAIMPLVGITVLSGEGATFEQGIADLRRQLRPRDDYDRHGWIVALLSPATRELLGRAARPRHRKRVALPPPGPPEDVVNLCHQMADKAKSGELRAIAIAGLVKDGIITSFANGDQDWRLLPVAVDHLRHRLLGD